MNYQLLLETAVLAGEIMLENGGETYRVEDTINHILKTGKAAQAESFVITTGIVATISAPDQPPLTAVKRISVRGNNLSRVNQVNSISRRLCAGKLSLNDAYTALTAVMTKHEYPALVRNLALIVTTTSFTALLGGSASDLILSAGIGGMLIAVQTLLARIRLSALLNILLLSFLTSAMTFGISLAVPIRFHTDAVTIAALMPLLPGVAFTGGIRDILYGDYSSGIARITEAVITAAAIAVGVAAAIALFGLPGGVLL